MSYSALGFSLPDLTVSGQAGPVAGWGGPLAVTVNVHNLGASTLIEPLNLPPGSVSDADSSATTLAVYGRPHNRPTATPILLGSIAVPAILQNDFARVTGFFNLPARPAGFPGSGGKIDISFTVNPNRNFLETDFTNNSSNAALPVTIQAALPDIQTIALDVPSVLNPGDVIQPNIRLANFGTIDTGLQGPVLVELVASLDKNFGPGDSILARYSIDNIPPISAAPSGVLTLGDQNLDPGANITTLQGKPIALPATPGTYYIGVIVDPNNTIKELHEVGKGPSFHLQQVKVVGPNTSGLPPASINGPFDPTVIPLFPFPVSTANTRTGGNGGNGGGFTLNGVSTTTTTSQSGVSSFKVGGFQSQAIKGRHRAPGGLVNHPFPALPAPSQGFSTNQITTSEQTGSALYPNNSRIPQPNVQASSLSKPY